MKYLKSYTKLLEANIPVKVEMSASDISTALNKIYNEIIETALNRDLNGEVLTIKAKTGDDYFVNFDNRSDVISITTKDNTSSLQRLLWVFDITKKPDNEAFMLYMDINERFGTLFDFICAIIAQL